MCCVCFGGMSQSLKDRARPHKKKTISGRFTKRNENKKVISRQIQKLKKFKSKLYTGLYITVCRIYRAEQKSDQPENGGRKNHHKI